MDTSGTGTGLWDAVDGDGFNQLEAILASPFVLPL
jgi:hypothetical protein